MISTVVDEVKVEDYVGLGDTAIKQIVAEEKIASLSRSESLARVEISEDGDELVIKTFKRSPIRRYRRITGYCVPMDNWNQSKLDELSHRVSHM